MNNKWIVITSIQTHKKALEQFDNKQDWKLIIVGDRKGPDTNPINNGVFLHIDKQKNLGYAYAEECPENHYARKNIGYLKAFQNNAEVIAESDDDNLPMENWGVDIDFSIRDLHKVSGFGFYNIYKSFTDKHIWPRGYPLNQIKVINPSISHSKSSTNVAVWQGLADIDPDVDAIYRLTIGDEVCFNAGEVVLGEGVYCPFNSQNTFWCKSAFLFMYLPSTVAFRYTDILRGYVCQRLLWKNNENLGFLTPSVVQERNFHDLHEDFIGEISMYTTVNKVIDLLSSIDLKGLNDKDAMIKVYSELHKIGVVEFDEIILLKLWLTDAEKLLRR